MINNHSKVTQLRSYTSLYSLTNQVNILLDRSLCNCVTSVTLKVIVYPIKLRKVLIWHNPKRTPQMRHSEKGLSNLINPSPFLGGWVKEAMT